MGQQTVHFRGSVADALAAIAGVPAAVAGGDAEASRDVLTAAGQRTLELLAERFDALSVPGGVYAVTGEQWPGNAPATVRRKVGGKGPTTRTGRRLAAKSGKGYAVGVQSGDMREAMEPGADGPSGHPQQVFRIERGAVVVGVRVPPQYPDYFAGGRPPRQPARPLVPAEFPAEWRRQLGEAVADQIGQVIVRRLGGRA